MISTPWFSSSVIFLFLPLTLFYHHRITRFFCHFISPPLFQTAFLNPSSDISCVILSTTNLYIYCLLSSSYPPPFCLSNVFLSKTSLIIIIFLFLFFTPPSSPFTSSFSTTLQWSCLPPLHVCIHMFYQNDYARRPYHIASFLPALSGSVFFLPRLSSYINEKE